LPRGEGVVVFFGGKECPSKHMSSTIHYAFGSFLGHAERLFERRWVQALLFGGVFLAAWLLGSPIAHASLV
jgi:hypothetical protein